MAQAPDKSEEIEHAPFSLRTPKSLPPQALTDADLSDADLDTLPYGLVCLDRSGTILRYNLAEARFARLDRAQVLGRSFFRDIAPCTATPSFQGRVDRFFADHQSARFEYLFDFKFGAQLVDVELQAGTNDQEVYLRIHRKRFDGPRRNLPTGFVGPGQLDLAPDEEAQGVRRDAEARREVVLRASFFHALHETWQRIAPRGWVLFAREWGLAWGRRSVVDLEADALERTGRALTELPMREVTARLSQFTKTSGLGALSVDFRMARDGALVISMERSAIAEAIGHANEPRCALLEGLFGALFGHVAGKSIVVRELSCRAQGAMRCTFLAVSKTRRRALDEALLVGLTTPHDVLAAIRTAPDEPRG